MSWTQGHIDEFRASGGKIAGPFEGRPVLLLTTGAKSGRIHTTPMMYLREQGHLYVFASKGGAPTNPDWYRNLVANPTVTVELGTERFEATARPLVGPDRDRVYAHQVELYPQFGEYERKTERTIPSWSSFGAIRPDGSMRRGPWIPTHPSSHMVGRRLDMWA